MEYSDAVVSHSLVLRVRMGRIYAAWRYFFPRNHGRAHASALS
jgi:hypothetical protein